eukprot:TRINITY_DN10052_c0_g1_i1.p1 TRINITY_DN10052_c0_g1~~TRINITY_DN10052_c0_g1_i1.p1  ORF type:complete len:941 (-),score=430.58 TRINITY_DN10052_c0_g1_i1:500-3322(-)
MPLRLDCKKKLQARSDRVKSVDIHPTEPWVLASLYDGKVYIWNYQTQNLVKSFEITDLPVRTAKFITRKQWIITGSDDMFICVYNYNTMEKVKNFTAHNDYVRCIVVHPTQPWVLSSSDDMLIKLWDWDKNWTNTQTFEGHTHYVMMLAINPKDTNTFCSASLDRTIKVWGFGAAMPHFTLEGHEKGVNTVSYFGGGEKPYLVSGADDKLVKIWDYQNKQCVQTLEGHSHNVSVALFHPELPIIISGSEDGTLKIWHANTYRLEKTLNYGLERVWALCCLKGSNLVAAGFDEGTVMLKLGREEPAASMDSSGKIILARHNEIQTLNVRTAEGEVQDGERLQLGMKELGNCEIHPQVLKHNPNGRFVVVCGDGEYIIYTALAWRNKSFGNALEFVWANTGTGEYAVRESSSKIKVFKNFKEVMAFQPSFTAEAIFGGAALGVRGRDFVCFYDWEQCRLIRRIDVVAKSVFWSEDGELVAVTSENSFFVLKYNKDAVNAFLSTGGDQEEGSEEAFTLLHEHSERVRTASWVGDCFIYTNSVNRLNYCVGSQVVTISHLDRHMYLLGYIEQTNKLYLIDKQFNIVGYTLHLTIINYQTAVLRGDLEAAEKIMPKIPQEHRNRIAHFLDNQGYKKQALEVSLDSDHKFELAVQLGELEIALAISREAASEHKWKQLADLALAAFKFDLAEECLLNAEDYAGLLLIYSSTGNAAGMRKLAKKALEAGKHNVSFVSNLLLGQLDQCLNVLTETGRVPEAAFLARTYAPSKVPQLVKLWRADLQTINEKAAESLADPTEYQNLFPDLDWALKAEQHFLNENLRPAADYLETRGDLLRDLIDEVKGLDLSDHEEAADADEFAEEEDADDVAQPSSPAAQPPSPKPVAAAAPSVASPAAVQRSAPAVVAEPVEEPEEQFDEDELAKELEESLLDGADSTPVVDDDEDFE